jgi:hypothetical protein
LRQQTALLDGFTAVLEMVIASERKEGAYDEGMLELNAGGSTVRIQGQPTVVFTAGQTRDSECSSAGTDVKTETEGAAGKQGSGGQGMETLHYVIEVDRGVSWEKAHAMFEKLEGKDDSGTNALGFYESKRKYGPKASARPQVLLVTSDSNMAMAQMNKKKEPRKGRKKAKKSQSTESRVQVLALAPHPPLSLLLSSSLPLPLPLAL